MQLKESKGKEIKENQIKEKDNDYIVVVVDALQKAGNLSPSPTEVTKLCSWVEEGMSIDLVAHAIGQAALNGKRNVSYMEGILRNYHKQGFTELKHVLAHEQDRQVPEVDKPKIDIRLVNDAVSYITMELEDFMKENPSNQQIREFLLSDKFAYDEPIRREALTKIGWGDLVGAN